MGDTLANLENTSSLAKNGGAVAPPDTLASGVKRLVVCCDGTQNDGVNTLKPITNVARIARCINNEDVLTGTNGSRCNVPQIVFYMRGVATGTSLFNNLRDSLFGRGMSLEKLSCGDLLLGVKRATRNDISLTSRRYQQQYPGSLRIPLPKLEQRR
jgi:hypothetical protein